MIAVEGYKMFRGIMKITYLNPAAPVEIIEGNWLYRPDTDCWYCKGRSFVAKNCHVVEDRTEVNFES